MRPSEYPTRTSVFYALPAMAAAVPTIPAYVLLPSYYGDDLGLGLAVTGIVLLLVRVIDMLTDPVVGWLSDKSGNRKLWTGLGAVIAGIGLWYLFSPPEQPVRFIFLSGPVCCFSAGRCFRCLTLPGALIFRRL